MKDVKSLVRKRISNHIWRLFGPSGSSPARNRVRVWLCVWTVCIYHISSVRARKQPRTWQLGQMKEQSGFLVSRSLTLPSASHWAGGVIRWFSLPTKKKTVLVPCGNRTRATVQYPLRKNNSWQFLLGVLFLGDTYMDACMAPKTRIRISR